MSYDSAPNQHIDNHWPPFARDLRRRRRRRSVFWSPGSSDAGEVFEKSGAIILTNGYVHEHLPQGIYSQFSKKK
jgi:hypothetical protein